MIECLTLTSVLWQGATVLPECSAVSLDVAGRGVDDVASDRHSN